MYSTDNGPHMNSWPDAGMTPFRNEKNSNWEGAYRVPAMVRWPGRIPAGHGPQRDRQPQRLVRDPARGGRRHRHRRPAQGRAPTWPARRTRCTSTVTTSSTTSPVSVDESPRPHFFYVSDDGDLTALRYDNWKFVFLEQRATGTLAIWAEPVHRAAGPEDLQPAHRPLRARRHHLEHLLRLDARPRLAADPGAGVRRADAPDAASSSRPGRSPPASASTR